MSFDLCELDKAVKAHGTVARVVIAAAKGSTPRNTGSSMLVWDGGQSGTIGGGTLEYEAARRARATLATGGGWLEHFALGPALGQCCGGQVSLLCEIFDTDSIPATGANAVFARATPGATTKQPPLAVQRLLSAARNATAPIKPQLAGGWMVEALAPPRQPLWIYGAGHVGRALVGILKPLPQFAIVWVDTQADRFPQIMPDGLSRLVAHNPADAVAHAPDDARHLILTYSHAIDLEICHRLLGQPFQSAGLIGSKSKWARFRRKLEALGHRQAQIARITCPIGRPELGKQPQAIAIGVAAALLQPERQKDAQAADSGKVNTAKERAEQKGVAG